MANHCHLLHTELRSLMEQVLLVVTEIQKVLH